MPPVSHEPLSILRNWHDEQQPLVRALSGPMVEEMTTALGTVQKVVDQQDKAIGELIARLESLERAWQEAAASQSEALQASQSEVADLTAKLQATTDRIGVLERKQFGRQSEKRKTPDARSTARKRVKDELSEEEKEARRAAAEAERKARLDALRTVTHTVELPPSLGEGRAMPPVTSVVYEWHPGELVRVEVTREQRALPEGFIATAPPIEQVVEGGCYGPALYAKICTDKCLNAMPLRRQERAFERLGAPLPISTLTSLFHRASELIKPIYDALQAHVTTSPHVQADETPLPVVDEHKTRKGWMWVFATSDALLFKHSRSRGQGVPNEVLGNTRGSLTVDGYTAYNIVTGALKRKRGGCWSHARRGLYDAQDHDPAFVESILADIEELFYVEELATRQRILGTPEHLALRKERSAPVVERLFAALEAYEKTAVDGRASLLKAVRYILNQREPLQLFLTDAAVPIHNNLSERALRIIALLRKNALFAGNDEAAQRFAQLLSLLATCQMHDVNPEVWLADVLLAINVPGLIAEDLLPWNWKLTRGTTYRPYFDTA